MVLFLDVCASEDIILYQQRCGRMDISSREFSRQNVCVWMRACMYARVISSTLQLFFCLCWESLLFLS